MWGRAFFVLATLEGTIFDGADLTYAYFDATGFTECQPPYGCDGYDDASFDVGSQTGDVNLDRELDILDLVSSVNNILNP